MSPKNQEWDCGSAAPVAWGVQALGSSSQIRIWMSLGCGCG